MNYRTIKLYPNIFLRVDRQSILSTIWHGKYYTKTLQGSKKIKIDQYERRRRRKVYMHYYRDAIGTI